MTAGAGTTVDNPVEAIANCALDMMDAGHRALMNPATGKPVKISVRNNQYVENIIFIEFFNSNILTQIVNLMPVYKSVDINLLIDC